jgi:hypothetical protein
MKEIPGVQAEIWSSTLEALCLLSPHRLSHKTTMNTLTDRVKSILKDRDLPAKDVIESALEDPRNAGWASKYLRPDTLLSKEELALYASIAHLSIPLQNSTDFKVDRYSKLNHSGILQPILRNPDIGATRPILEDDLRNAIETLEASTATIQKQTENLKLQCASLNKQLSLENNVEQQRNRDIARLRKKHEAGRQNTTMAVGEGPT